MCYTKTRGKAGDEDQELVPPSGSLSNSAILKILKYLRQLSGEEGKRLLQGLFPSPCVQQGHPSYPSAAGFASWSHLLQKNILEVPLIHKALKSAGQKKQFFWPKGEMITAQFQASCRSLPNQSQAKGLTTSAKSSFAAANTAAYYGLIWPDPGLMQDLPRLERMGRGWGGIIP